MPIHHDNNLLKERIRQQVLALGADVCGFAEAAAFAGAPEGFRPGDIFSETRTAVVFGLAIPEGTLRVSPRIVYGHFNGMGPDMVDAIAYRTALWLERTYDVLAVPLPADAPVDCWNPETLTARGLMSMKHAAVLAGLGTLGKNTLLLNKTYGNRLTVGLLLTDLALPGDPPADEVCIPGCRKCLDSCPAHALDGVSANQTLCRPNAYGTNDRGLSVCTCNTCRTVCPVGKSKPQ